MFGCSRRSTTILLSRHPISPKLTSESHLEEQTTFGYKRGYPQCLIFGTELICSFSLRLFPPTTKFIKESPIRDEINQPPNTVHLSQVQNRLFSFPGYRERVNEL
ncbi:hypothetical protein Droror1_Dr00011773 [Drosera rotundifolia]